MVRERERDFSVMGHKASKKGTALPHFTPSPSKVKQNKSEQKDDLT